MVRVSLRLVAGFGVALVCSGASGCEGRGALPPVRLAGAAATAPPSRPWKEAPPPESRPQLDGRSFPDKVLALTWDDGPDVNTLALASYLSRERVSATFFVVREWSGGLSADPGSGTNEFETGYEYLPILGDLVALGHRVGNHTSNHVLLTQVLPALADEELKGNQESIDPFLTNELRIFRAPGGAWGARASRATDADPYLVDFIGPIRWDIDRKDWESSVDCRSSRPAVECEPGGPGRRSRVRPEVVARRYLASIEAAGHGVVLFHDRVGDVGSTYAIDVAEHVIPELVRRGFVFVAPVLGFGEPRLRLALTDDGRGPPSPSQATLQLGDLDGDGRADVCVHAPGDRRCALSVELRGTDEDRRPRTVFETSRTSSPASCGARFESEDIQLADVDGDGHADLCATMGFGVACAIGARSGECAPALKWSLWDDGTAASTVAPEGRRVRFGDIDGDGKADLCALSDRGVVCARSTGRGFEREESWAAATMLASAGRGPGSADSLALADVNGDGRADACWTATSGLWCARLTGARFDRAELWSPELALSGASRLLFGDLNGDARADVCSLSKAGVACGLSTGRSFTRTSTWLAPEASSDSARLVQSVSLAIADVNGDKRADLCGYGPSGVVCALAP